MCGIFRIGSYEDLFLMIRYFENLKDLSEIYIKNAARPLVVISLARRLAFPVHL